MIAPVVRCLSMMLECNYLLREDEQLMHKCHQQNLHLYNITRAAHVPSWSLLHIGSSNNCFSRATIMHQVNGVGTRVLMGDAWEVHWTTLPEATQACRELIYMMLLQERLQRTLQMSESCSRVHCTLLLWCSD